MAMDVTQLQAVLTARDEATPVIQSFLGLIRQARDAASGYGAATTTGLSSTTQAWQAQFEASQKVIAGLTAIPNAANAAASSLTGIGQAASAASTQITPMSAALTNMGPTAQNAGRVASSAIQSVGQAAQVSSSQIQQMVQNLAAASAARAATEAQIARSSVQQFGQGTLPTGSGFSATGQSASDLAAQRALADAQRQAVINSTQAVQTAIPNINQASEAWTRYSSAVSGSTGPTTEAVNRQTQMRQSLIAAGTSISEVEARTKALRDTTGSSTTAAKAHSEAWVSLGGIMSHLPGPLGDVGAAFGTIHEKITPVQASMLALGAIATTIGVSMLAGLGSAIEQAGNFQRTFADVEAITNATGEQMDQFKEKALELGVQTQFSSQKVAEGFYELSSSGLSVKESLNAIEPAIMAATLGHQQLGTTTLQLAGIMRQFGLDASDLNRVVDVQTRIVSDSLLHWSQMGEAFRNVQGAARFMNISIEETGAALEVMANAGTTATMSGTAFRTFLDRMAKGTGEAGAAIQALNLHIYDQNGAFVGLLPLMQQIEAATAGMTDKEKDGIIAKLGGARANALIRDTINAKKDVEIDGQTVTLRGTEVLNYFIQRNMDAAGAAKTASDIIKTTFNFQMEVFQASVQEASIRVGNQLIPVLTRLIPIGTAAVNAFVQGGPGLQAATTDFLAIGGASATLLGTMTTLRVVVPLLMNAFKAEGILAGFGPQLIGISLALGALTVASTVFAAAWSSDFGGFRTEVETDVIPAVQNLTAEVRNIGTAISNDVMPHVNELLDALRSPDFTTNIGQGIIDLAIPQGGLSRSLGTDEEWRSRATQVGTVYIETLKDVVIASLPGGSFVRFVVQDVETWRASGVQAGRVLMEGLRVGAKGATAAIPGGSLLVDAVFGKAEDQAREMEIRGAQLNNDYSQQLKQITDTAAKEGQLASQSFDSGFESVRTNVDFMRDLTPEFDQMQPQLAAKGIDLGAAFMNAWSSSLTNPQRKDVADFVDQMSRDMATAAPEFGETAEQFDERWEQAFKSGMYARFPAISGLMLNLMDAYFLQAVNVKAEQAAKTGATTFVETLQDAVKRLMAEGGGKITTAIDIGVSEGNQEVVNQLLKTAEAHKLVQSAIKDTNTDFQAEVRIMEQARDGESDLQAEYRTLFFLLETGNITQEQFNKAIMGESEARQKVKTALQEHKAQIQEWLGSTSAATVASGLFAESLDKTVEKYGRVNPAVEASVRAFVNAGQEMEAAGVVANALGVDLQTVIDAAHGNQVAIDVLDAAYAKATGTHKALATAAKETKQALDELSRSTDPAKVQIALLDKEYSNFATSTLPKLPLSIRSQVQALLNANDTMGAARVAAGNWGRSLADVNEIVDGNVAATAKWNAALKGEVIPAMNSYAQAVYDLNPNLDRAKQAGAEFGLTVDHASEIVTRATAIQKEWQAALREDAAAGRDTARSFTVLRDSFQQAADEIARAANKAKGSAADFRQVGGYIKDGIQAGFQGYDDTAVTRTIMTPLEQARQNVRSELRAYSPSQLWAETVGSPIAQGIAVGVSNAMPEVYTAVRSGLEQVVSDASDYGVRAGQLFSTGFDDGSSPGGTNPYSQANQALHAQQIARETGYTPNLFGLDPGYRDLQLQRQADHFMAAQQQYWMDQFGTSDPAKAQAAYQASLPASTQTSIIFKNLMDQSASSLFSSLTGKLPLAVQAGYQQMAQGSPEALMRALQTLWQSGGGSPTALSDLLNNVQNPSGYNPLLGQSANAILAGGATGGAGGAGGAGSLGTSGSGEASVPLYASVVGGVVDASNATRQTNDGMAAMNTAISIANTHMQNLAKNLASSVPLVMQSWSSISDYTKQSQNSMSDISGAFSAYKIDLNSKMASSISGSWTVGTVGGPSGPISTGPGSGAVTASGNTYGGQSFGALQDLAARIIAAHPDASPDAQARLIQQGMRTDAQYHEAVGDLTDTTDDLRRQQNDASIDLMNLRNAMNTMGDGFASSNGMLSEFQSAMARLNDATNALAARGTFTPSAPPPSQPWQGTPGGPPPKEPPPDAPPGHWVVGAYGQGWQWLPDSVSGGTLPTGTTGGTFSNNVPTPPTTTTTTTTTTPTGPVLIASTGTEDIYRMPDGTIKRYPKGTGPTVSTGGGIDSAVFAAIPPPLPLPTTVAPQTGSDAGSPAGASIAVTVPVTVTTGAGQDGQQVGQKFAAVILKAVVEEGRRQGYDITKAGNK
jgi:TP901 family phage tail tape measure protein